MIRLSNPGRTRDFSLLPNVLSGSGFHPASYSIGIGVFSLHLKAVGAVSLPLTSTTQSLRMNWAVRPRLLYAFMQWTGTFSLLTILELLFEPTSVSDCPLSPSGKSHCSGCDQSSAALNRDTNKKIRIGHALPACHQSRQAHHLTLYEMDLSYLLQRLCCPKLYFQETAPSYHFDLSAPHPHCPSPLTWPIKFWQDVTIVLASTSSRFVIQIFWNADSYSWFSGMAGSAEGL